MVSTSILFLSANPIPDAQLALMREAQLIRTTIEQQRLGRCLDLQDRWAAEPLDLLRALRTVRPRVVHFSGHGGEDGLCFHGPNGQSKTVSPAALATTLSAAGSCVDMVVLNACYSDAYTDALLSGVCRRVVGMGGEIQDDEAMVFSARLYGLIASGLSVGVSFEQARLQRDWSGPGPQIRVVDPKDLDLVLTVPREY